MLRGSTEGQPALFKTRHSAVISVLILFLSSGWLSFGIVSFVQFFNFTWRVLILSKKISLEQWSHVIQYFAVLSLCKNV